LETEDKKLWVLFVKDLECNAKVIYNAVLNAQGRCALGPWHGGGEIANSAFRVLRLGILEIKKISKLPLHCQITQAE
jgi:hypothetical protein